MAFEVGERAFLLGGNFKTHDILYKHESTYLAWAAFFSSGSCLIIGDVCVLTRDGFSDRNDLNSSSLAVGFCYE